MAAEVELTVGEYGAAARWVEIAAAGGGIHASVRDLRARSEDELVELAVPRLREMLAHGTPSGIDNTIATYAKPMLFRNGAELEFRELQSSVSLPLVIGCSSQGGLTKELVAGVRARREQSTEHYDAIFVQLDALSLAGAAALERGDLDELGRLMNICQGLLNAIEVSTPELEAMVAIARAAGAVGAKLTGAGGGGSMIALCPGCVDEVAAALQASGFRTMGLD